MCFQGAVFAKNQEENTMENVEAMFDDICNFDNSLPIENINEATLRVMDSIMKEQDNNRKFVWQKPNSL